MRKETKECLIKLKKEIQYIRKKALPLHTTEHHIDLDYKSWNNPVDGLDYALNRIDILLEIIKVCPKCKQEINKSQS